jgi:conserved oligomeric Golgi complex subunit 5
LKSKTHLTFLLSVHDFFYTKRLRQKICIPYHSLQSKVKQLHQLQQASDVLRRMSRFIMLAKRLEAQMAELGVESLTEADTSSKPHVTVTAGRSEEHEDEKERTIAKAAHSISELRKSFPITA